MPFLLRLLALPILLFPLAMAHGQAPQRYSCFTDHIFYDAWCKDPKRSIGPDGYYRYEKRFHPLSVATGGILAYERFVETGDSAYFRLLRDQVRYFSDTARVDTAFGGRGIGIPYDWAFGKLKAPWYSGMTQGVALSLLIRYEHLTGDPAMPPLLRKIAYFMVQPEASGGTLSTTLEGETWIEEYPHSSDHRHVLNGFINALIGLMEYSERFPEDTMAARIEGECFAALRSSFAHYDRVEWSSYDRSGGGLTNGYMQYQLLQLKQLVDRTGDPVLHDQIMLWSVYATDKPNREKPLHMRKKGWHPSARLIARDSVLLAPEIQFEDAERQRRVVPVPGRVRPARSLNTKAFKHGRSWTLTHVLPKPVVAEYLELVHDTLPKPMDITVWARDTTTGRFMKAGTTVLPSGVDRLRLRMAPTLTDQLVLQLRARVPFAPDSARIRLRIGSLGPDLMPWTAHERIGPLKVEPEHPYVVLVPADEATGATVFYRTGKDLRAIKNTPWRTGNTVVPGNVVVTDKPYVEFLVVHELKDPQQTFHRSVVNPLSVPPQ